MSRTGIVVALLFVLAAVAIGSLVRVTGPGRRGAFAPAPVLASVAASAPGRLVVPVQGVAPAALVDSFTDPRGDGTRLHHAIDIAAPVGTPVLAAADGRIEKMFTSGLGGLTLYERSPDGSTVYYYAHLAGYAPTLAEGAAVRAGQIIAEVGASGDADPGAPHLHFEVHRMAPGEQWWQGREVDPFPLLRAGG